MTDSNPPVDRFGYTDVTTTCCAIRRDVLEACGGFDEDLLRGVDSELFVRVRTAGYRLVLAPGVWAYHAAPATLGRLIAKHVWYGIGYAQEVRRQPERAAGRALATPVDAVAYLLERTVLAPLHAFVPYSHSEDVWRLGCKPVRALTSYAAAVGYVYEWTVSSSSRAAWKTKKRATMSSCVSASLPEGRLTRLGRLPSRS